MAAFTRRTLLGLIPAVVGGCSHAQPTSWDQAEALLATIEPPKFPDRTWDIRDFGARAGADVTVAIGQAIDLCHRHGGGRVLIPSGVWACRGLRLLSNVNLHLEKGACLRFSTRPEDYLPAVLTRWEGVELMGYAPLIYAYQQENIAITGEGVLDGQADKDHWWGWKGGDWARPGVPTQAVSRDALFAAAEQNVPVAARQFSRGHFLRPAFIQPYQCSRLLIEGVRIINAPFWLVHPVLCQEVIVRKVQLQSLGPNSDGVNPESCDRVLIENCFFDTGDDCIAIKSGRNNDGRRLNVPCKNILVRNCQMQRGHGAVVIGSEISGGAENILVENCTMSSPDLERGLRIKTNARRGGVIRNIHLRNITIGQVQDAIVINFHYEEGLQGQFMPEVGGIKIENLMCAQAKRIFDLRGFAAAPIGQVELKNCRFNQAESLGVIEHAAGLTIETSYINNKPLQLPT